MNFILFHIGDVLLDHIRLCIKQIKFTNPGKKIYLITNLNVQTNDNDVQIVNTKDLSIPDIGNYYQNNPMSALFRNAMLRIFYLNAFITKYNIEDVIHFDNDVLIYENVDSIKNSLSKFNFLITPSNKNDYVFGFSYFKNSQNLSIVTEKLRELVVLGESALEKKLQTMPHEMRLVKYINEQADFKLIDLFPILPGGIHNHNYNWFNCCFDPLPYGQYLGGLPPEEHHYIGKKVLDGDVKIYFENKKPYATFQGMRYGIFNLHIWNKQLHKFISYE